MKKHLLTILAMTAVFAGQAFARTPFTGIVFQDSNRNGTHDVGEKALSGIRVSNGREVVQTDKNGAYTLPGGTEFVFVIKPSGWMTPEDGNQLPEFCSRSSKHDFPLYERKEPDHFKAIIFADPQVDQPEHVNFFAHDIVEELIGTEAAFGLTLGDLVNNKPELFAPLMGVIGKIGISWYNIKGNHDVSNSEETVNTFENNFGPSYYSFDYAKVHFVALDTNKPLNADSDQLAFLKNDLNLVPKNQMVVLLMHFPMKDVGDRAEIYRQLEAHPNNLSLSGHMHEHQEYWLTPADGWKGKEPHHHVSNPPASGLWWSGEPDELGIPNAMTWDGNPNGYSIITFDKNSYKIRFKVARRPADYQMNIYAPESVPSKDAETTEVLVNVFAGAEKSKVEMKFDDGPWAAMKKVLKQDPNYLRLLKVEAQLGSVPWPKLLGPRVCTHLWSGNLPTQPRQGDHIIYIRTTDEYGQTFAATRVINVK